MPICKTCGKKRSFWTSFWTVCPDCAAKHEAESPEERLLSLLDIVAKGEVWESYGVALWTSLGHKASQKADLWIGRALLGVGGDILHSETQLMGLLGLTKSGRLHFAKIGECSEITPAVIKTAAVHTDTIMSAPLARLSLSRERDGKLTIDGFANGQRYSLTFPSCFLAANAEFPRRLLAETTMSDGGSSDQPRSLLERCPYCGSQVLFVTSSCPSCGKQKR